MPILTKKRHKYTPLPGNRNRNGKSKKTSNNIIELLCNTNFKRITIGTLIFVLLIYYLLRKRITSSSDATLLRAIPKAVHIRTKGTSTFESFEKPTPASTNDKQYNGRDADAFLYFIPCIFIILFFRDLICFYIYYVAYFNINILYFFI